MQEITHADRAHLRQLARQTNIKLLVTLPVALILMVVLIESVPPALSGLAAGGSGVIGIGLAIACSGPFRAFKAQLGLTTPQTRELLKAEQAKHKAARSR